MSFVLALVMGSATACSPAEYPRMAFWPEGSAQAVPVDVLPEVWLPDDLEEPGARLRDADGALVDTVVEEGTRDQSLRLVPTADLLPDALYTLELTTGGDVFRSSDFTTGTERVDPIEGPPAVTYLSADGQSFGTGGACEPAIYWDVFIDPGEPTPAPLGGRRYHVYEVTRDGDILGWVTGGTAEQVARVWVEVDDLSEEICIALLAEDGRGEPSGLSETLCMGLELDALDTGFDDAAPSGESGGCSVAPGAPLGGALVGLLALATRRRR